AHARDAGEQLFPGYGTAPFGLLLERDGRELLLCHKPVKGFTPGETDAATGCTTQMRTGQHFSDKLLAAMPALDNEAVIVMGTPQTTGRTQGQWIRTLY